ncbi:MAG: hypothetical protein ABJA34_12875 [Pseudonocardiales bacterium]
MTANEARLGVDIGRVIIDGPRHGSADTAFFTGGLAEALRTPAVPGAFDALAELTARFDRRVWLISKCGVRIEGRSLAWLDHHDFYRRTGIPADNVRFCRRRVDKAPICAGLAITHFIDDRVDVLAALRNIVPQLFLFRTPAPHAALAWLTPLAEWAAAAQLVLPER